MMMTEPTSTFHIVFQNGATIVCKALEESKRARGSNMDWLGWWDILADEVVDDEKVRDWSINDEED